MITAAIVALVMQGANTRDFLYSGVPYLVEAAPGLVRIPTHDVQVQITKDSAQVSSTTAFKNTTNQPLHLTLVIPRRQLDQPAAAMPTFDIAATWDGTPLVLAPFAKGRRIEPADGGLTLFAKDLSAKVDLGASATASLRITYEIPLGRTAYALRQRVAGYLLGGRQPIEQLNLTYLYSGDTVFRLPEAFPDYPWQIGSKGAFLRLSNFQPKSNLTYIQFYPGGFEDIGN